MIGWDYNLFTTPRAQRPWPTGRVPPTRHVDGMADGEPHVERQFGEPTRDLHGYGRFALDYGCEQLRHADFVGDDGHRRRRSQHDDSGHWCG